MKLMRVHGKRRQAAGIWGGFPTRMPRLGAVRCRFLGGLRDHPGSKVSVAAAICCGGRNAALEICKKSREIVVRHRSHKSNTAGTHRTTGGVRRLTDGLLCIGLGIGGNHIRLKYVVK